MNVIREFFNRWGVPEEISLDGAPNFSSIEIKRMLESWGVRASYEYFPQSNGRAEAGVKSMKRLLAGNLGPKGSIDNDKVAQALLQYRNTPLRDGGASPAQLALGRHIRDTIPLPQQRYKIDPSWSKMLNKREASMADRAVASTYQLEIKFYAKTPKLGNGTGLAILLNSRVTGST